MAVPNRTWDPKTGSVILRQALEDFDWEECSALCVSLAESVRSSPDLYPAESAEEALTMLRNYRRFYELKLTANAFLESGQQAPTIRKLYAQALIELSEFPAAEDVLARLAAETKGKVDKEYQDAQGLLGRLYKQRYVFSVSQKVPRTKDLVAATKYYLAEYERKPDNLYLAVNALALVERARRDRVPIRNAPDAKKLAKAIIKKVLAKRDTADAWDLASAMEASLVLGDRDASISWLNKYVRSVAALTPKTKARKTASSTRSKQSRQPRALETRVRRRLERASAFTFASTLRQLQQVWQLDSTHPIGGDLIRGLWAALLAAGGGVDVEMTAAELAATATAGRHEAAWGPDRWVPVHWFNNGMQCALSVVRIQNARTKEHCGTGFLLVGRTLHPRLGDELILLTNSHVVSTRDDVHAAESEHHPVWPADAEVIFDGIGGLTGPPVSAIWESPPDDEDTTILRFKEPIVAEGFKNRADYALYARQLPQGGGARIYAIGYPQSGQLSFSFHHSRLLEMNDKYLHYRTPTAPGSSGSPLFDATWRLVGIHHFSSKELSSLKRPGEKYPGNRGVWIGRIRQAYDKRRDLDVNGRDAPADDIG